MIKKIQMLLNLIDKLLIKIKSKILNKKTLIIIMINKNS